MIAKKIVAEIIKELNDRSCGIDNCDRGIQAEIVKCLEAIVVKQLKLLTQDKTESEIAQEILQEVFSKDT